MTSAEEEMTETTAPSTQDEEELVEKEDNSIEKDDEEEEEGLFEKEGQGGEEIEDGVNQVVKEDNAIEANGEELLEKQEEGKEDVEEVEQEVNKKGEQEKKAEAHTIVSGSTDNAEDNAETKTASTKKQKEKEQKAKQGEAVLNVNNQVVKMRTEVKRVRALLIRKLLRHLADLKKKKGKETDLEKNQRRVDRLLEEIRQMKRLRPDQVTKTALVNDFNFEKVCKDLTTTMSQRALARIATHPQFSKKIDVIKAAVKAFDEERKKEKQKQKMTPFQEEEEQYALKQKEEEDQEETEDEEAEENDENATIAGLSEPGTETAAPVDETTETSDQTKSEILARSKTVVVSKSVKMASTKSTEIKDILKETQQGKPTATKAPEKKRNIKPAPKMQQSNKDEEDDDGDEEEEDEEDEDEEEKQSNDDDKEDKGGDEEEEESDLESSDEEEKEYFDDSTEERFHKQSEGSESEDDFFVGKVSKFKKKKKALATTSLKSQTSDEGQTDKPKSELNYKAPKSELNYKAPKLASVFCSTLSSSKPSRGGLSRDRGRGGDRSRGRGRGADRGGGTDRFSKSPSKFQKQDGAARASKFQKQDGAARGKPGFKNTERGSEARQFQSEDKDRTFTGRGTGRGRGGVARQQDHRGPGGFSHQAPQQALHPSWEASKKRKEQQGQIMAFQGKKIKFDDDD